MAASFASGRPIPPDIAALGVTAAGVSPGRACVIHAEGAVPLVGSREAFQ